jgi:hypothetical protein
VYDLAVKKRQKVVAAEDRPDFSIFEKVVGGLSSLPTRSNTGREVCVSAFGTFDEFLPAPTASLRREGTCCSCSACTGTNVCTAYDWDIFSLPRNSLLRIVVLVARSVLFRFSLLLSSTNTAS